MRPTKQKTLSSRSRVLALASLSVVWLIFGISTPARADALGPPIDPRAREHLTTGNRYYRRLHDFEKAIEEYKAGALREDAPVFYYNLGQCYRMLGRYKDAIWHYERFLERGKPMGEMEASTKKFITEMKAELEKAAVKPPAASAPDPSPPLSASPVPIAVVRNRNPQWYEDAFGWGLVGAGTVAVGASGLMFWSASSFNNQANSEPNQRVQEQLRDKSDTRQLLGMVIGIGGAALAVTGVVKLTINGSDRAHGLSWGIGSGGAMVFGKF